MSEKLEPLFTLKTVAKVVEWGYGKQGWRVCRACMVKQSVSSQEIARWLMGGHGSPDCGRCHGPTEILRTDQSHMVAGYRAVTPSAQNKSQDSIPDTIVINAG